MIEERYILDFQLELIQIRYTDVPGKFLAKYLSTPADIEGFFKHGIGLDGLSVRRILFCFQLHLLRHGTRFSLASVGKGWLIAY
jgi:hypothetical protein